MSGPVIVAADEQRDVDLLDLSYVGEAPDGRVSLWAALLSDQGKPLGWIEVSTPKAGFVDGVPVLQFHTRIPVKEKGRGLAVALVGVDSQLRTAMWYPAMELEDGAKKVYVGDVMDATLTLKLNEQGA